MTELSNLVALRATIGISAQLAYVKGHTTAGDGGGGMFIWRTDSAFTSGVYAMDNNGTIIQATGNNTGRWVRQYDGYLDVRYFGAFGLGGDYTVNIQRAIDFAALNSISYTSDSILKGATVYIPNGDYSISTLTLKHKVSVMGESLEETRLHCNGLGTATGMFEIEKGAVFINVSNLHCLGENTDKTCFYLEAKPEDPQNANSHGGLWNSTFKNIQIKLFKGDGIFLKGGINGRLPNQFNTFENVRVSKIADFTHSLKMVGQIGQHTFLNCTFDGFYNSITNTYSRGHNVYITTTDNSWYSAVVSFINCTCQDADYGMYIEHGENITVDNCWFENLGVAVTIRDVSGIQSRNINVLNSRFANASGFGSISAPNNIKNGQNISVTNSFVNLEKNYITASNPSQVNSGAVFLVAMNNTLGGVHMSDNLFSDQRLSQANNIVAISGGSQLSVGGNKLVLVSQTGSSFSSVKSNLNPGEYLVVKANGAVTFSNSSVLSLGGKTSLALVAGETATFVKTESLYNSESYLLVTFTKGGSI